MLRVRPARQDQLRRCDDAMTGTRDDQQARSQLHFVAQGQPIALRFIQAKRREKSQGGAFFHRFDEQLSE